MGISWPISNDTTTGEPIVRPRRPLRSGKVIEYKVTMVDVQTLPGFLFVTLARNFFGDGGLDWIIRDNNLKVREQDIVEGDIVRIPFDAMDLADSGARQTTKLSTISFFQNAEDN